jgi:hypothetical protein
MKRLFLVSNSGRTRRKGRLMCNIEEEYPEDEGWQLVGLNEDDCMIDLEDFENVLGSDSMGCMMIQGEIAFMKLSGQWFTDSCQKYLAEKLEEMTKQVGNPEVFHDSYERKAIPVGLGDSPESISEEDAKKYFGNSWRQLFRTMRTGTIKVEMNVKTAIAMKKAGFKVMCVDNRNSTI